MNFENTAEFASNLDKEDTLRNFRDRFYIPLLHGKEVIYFTGNSLGLQPKSAQDKVLNIMEDWANYGVEGHFSGRSPWISYHDQLPAKFKNIIGAEEDEIVIMNFLTVNLHLLFCTFYKPTSSRYKIICEAKAFPSDQYAFESQALLHGLDPNDTIIEVSPRKGEYYIRTEDIISTIELHKDSLSVVFFSGVNYYTGEVFDMPSITKAAHAANAFCGFDLAHAIGNVHLDMHLWDVDFAVWCNYKYLNAGPGAIGGAFINNKHTKDPSLQRLSGWWGYDKETRFKMEKGFKAIPTAEGWQLSTPPGILMSLLLASLEIFEEAGFENLIRKSAHLTGYLYFIIEELNREFGETIEIITPQEAHGCQVSLLIHQKGKQVFDALKKEGILTDWREPNVIRVSPVPLYNTFMDVYKFGTVLKKYAFES